MWRKGMEVCSCKTGCIARLAYRLCCGSGGWNPNASLAPDRFNGSMRRGGYFERRILRDEDDRHDRWTLPADRIDRIALCDQAARAATLSPYSLRLGHHDQAAAQDDRAFAPEPDSGAAISRRNLSR